MNKPHESITNKQNKLRVQAKTSNLLKQLVLLQLSFVLLQLPSSSLAEEKEETDWRCCVDTALSKAMADQGARSFAPKPSHCILFHCDIIKLQTLCTCIYKRFFTELNKHCSQIVTALE